MDSTFKTTLLPSLLKRSANTYDEEAMYFFWLKCANLVPTSAISVYVFFCNETSIAETKRSAEIRRWRHQEQFTLTR